MSTIEDDGTVLVEGEVIGHLHGFRFVSDVTNSPANGELRAAAAKTVSDEIAARAVSLTAAPDQDIMLDEDGAIVWQSQKVAKLAASEQMLKPAIKLLADENLTPADRQAVEFRLGKFLQRHISAVLGPLQNLAEDEEITGLARGVVFRICENLGVVDRKEIADDIKVLDQTTRGSLRKHGVRFGAYHVFLPALLKPAATQLRLLLWKLFRQKDNTGDEVELPPVPGQGLTSASVGKDAPAVFYLVAGYKVCGNRIVRIDMLERLGDMIRKRVFWRPAVDIEERPEGSVEGGGFTAIPDMMSLVGCSGSEFSEILKTLGYKCEQRAVEKPDQPEQTEQQTEASDEEQMQEPNLPVVENATADLNPETAQEPEFLEVWWPENTGPFKRGPGKDRSGNKGPKRHRKKPVSGKQPAKKKKPAINVEDSPFAALAALKKDLK